MDLYTIDVSPENLLKEKGVEKVEEKTMFQKKKAKVIYNIERDELMNKIADRRITIEMWKNDKDIMAMR